MPTVPGENPEHAADVADDVLGQRAHIRTQPRLVEHLARESGPQSKPIEGKGNHARYVGIRLFQRDARLEPRDTAVAEVSDAHLGPIEAERQQHGRIGAQELERRRENADHLARPAINVQRSTDHIWCAAEPTLPISVTHDRPPRAARRIIFLGEESAEQRLHPQDREQTVGHP